MMKTTLKRLCFGIMLAAGMLTATTAYSQIDYFEDFSGTDDRWLGNDFHTTDVAVCDNEAAFRANPVNDTRRNRVAQPGYLERRGNGTHLQLQAVIL